MTFDAYTVYCDHCIARGQTPPTRAWWDSACKQTRNVIVFESDVQFDADTERREGWVK